MNVEDVTVDCLESFVREELKKSGPDGQIEAMARAAAAALCAVENALGHGSGTMSGMAIWKFIRLVNPMLVGKVGARIINYEDMLYPQYREHFQSIPLDVWKTMQKEAAERLRDGKARTKEVQEHWQRIVDGVVPFGFRVR